jgi:hypothetical protein
MNMSSEYGTGPTRDKKQDAHESRRRRNTRVMKGSCYFTVVTKKCIALVQIGYKVEAQNDNHNHGLVLKFITYFGIRYSVQVSDPSGGYPGLSHQLKADSELLRNPTNPTNSYELLWILRILRTLRSSIDSNYCCVYRRDFRPTAK